jgi:ABC-type transport system involved in cytochrome c biogenesis permease component
MTFLPVVVRELRVAARRPGTYWNRLLAAAIALAIASTAYAVLKASGVPELGFFLFMSLAWLEFFFCVLAGPRLTADTISEERREGTLGLLFLTDLKGYDIVLGKLAASSINGVYSLLSAVPILGLCLLLGGVSGRQFGLTVLVLLNTLFCSLALGCWVSTWFENGRRALLVSALFMSGLCLLPWLGMWLSAARADFSTPPNFLWTVPSPILALVVAILPPTALPPASVGPFAELFWPSMGCTFALGLLGLMFSSRAVTRVWRDRPAGSWRARWLAACQRFKYGAGPARAAHRARLLAINPIYWLLARDRLAPELVWAFLVGAAAFFGWVTWQFPNDWLEADWLTTFSQCLYGVLKLWIAAVAVARLAEDKRSGALELLLTVPLTLGDLRDGLRRALQRQFLGPVLAVLAMDAWFCHLSLQSYTGIDELSPATYAARMSLLVLDAATLWQLGPWVAVTARHPNQAVVHLLIYVCVLPWLAFLGGTVILGLLDLWRIWQPELGEGHFLAAWFGLGLVNDLFWLAWARRQMAGRFREAAAARFPGKRRGWWGGGTRAG